MINTKSFQLTSFVFNVFILLLPIMGVVIDFRESFFFFLIPILFSINLFFETGRNKHTSTPINLYFQGSLVLLFIISTILSLNPGSSYYYMWGFVNIILILNLANIYIVSTDRFFQITIAVSLVYSLVLILSKTGVVSIPINALGDNFILQVWGHSYLGNFLLIPITICIYKIMQHRRKLYFMYLTIFTFSLLLSQSRSGLVGAIVSTIALTSTSNFTRKARLLFTSFLVILLSALLIFSGSRLAKYKSADGSRPSYWRQALVGIQQSPIFGNGPSTFNVINRQHKKPLEEITNTAHNSILEYLSNNGVIFTLILLVYIFIGLSYQRKQLPIFFSLGLGLLLSSLLDSFLASPGFIVLFFIFSTYHHPLFYSPNHKSSSQPPLTYILSTCLLIIFFISKTTSDITYFLGRYTLSSKLDPFNLNSLIQQNNKSSLATALAYYKNDESVLMQATARLQLPQSLPYFSRLLEVFPQSSTGFYSQLGQYFMQTGKYNELRSLLEKYNYQFNNDKHFVVDTDIAKLYYHLSLYHWQNREIDLAISSMQKSILYSGGWSQFHIELANIYYHSNQKNLAKLQLTTKCAQYPPSVSMCSQYLVDYPGSLPLPGDLSMRKSIDNIP